MSQNEPKHAVYLAVGGPFHGATLEANYGGGGEFDIERRIEWPNHPAEPFTETHNYALVCRGETCYLVYVQGVGKPLARKS